MKISYRPDSALEKFGTKVFETLVENFSKTYLVGGTVRDILLGRKITDIDIATSATPAEVVDVLKRYFIECNIGFQSMGVIVASDGPLHVAVATFRKDLPAEDRYPEVVFTRSAETDAKRRDFTVNALYFQPNSGVLLDFYEGAKDIKKRQIRFIGKPAVRISQDPLRIVRALRFALTLGFTLEHETHSAIKQNMDALGRLSRSRVEKEIEKVKLKKQKKILDEVINNPLALDKYF